MTHDAMNALWRLDREHAAFNRECARLMRASSTDGLISAVSLSKIQFPNQPTIKPYIAHARDIRRKPFYIYDHSSLSDECASFDFNEEGGPVHWRGYQWAVTDYGLECVESLYPIDKERLWENEDNKYGSWIGHMSGKDWVTLSDFTEGLRVARRTHSPRRFKREPVPNRLRFQILSRDGFRCVYCKNDQERLHVDHVTPVVRGGRTVADNLVTACESCNLGKGSMTVDFSALDLMEEPQE